MDDSAPTTLDPPREQFALVPVRRHVPALAAGLVLLAVLATWLFGHLPWVLDGFRTPARSDVPGSATEGLAQVRIAVPLVASQITALVAFTAIGSVAATLLPLAFPDLPRPLAVALAALTLGGTTVALALAARATVSANAAGDWVGDERVLDGLVAGVLLVAVCAGSLGCLASAQVGFLPLPVAVLVGQLPAWIGGLGGSHDLDVVLYRVASLVLLGAAFVISVRRSAWWALLWPAALAIVWVATPMAVATTVLQGRLRPGSGVDEDNLGDVLLNAREVFAASFWDAPRTWWPGAVALALALVWLLVKADRARRSPVA